MAADGRRKAGDVIVCNTISLTKKARKSSCSDFFKYLIAQFENISIVKFPSALKQFKIPSIPI